MKKTLPTVFHITHWKSGSQWVAEVLRQSAPERFVQWRILETSANQGKGMAAFIVTPLKPGSVYGTVYLHRERFEGKLRGYFRPKWQETYQYPLASLSNWWNYEVRKLPTKRFFVMRDARDTLISFYFSTKKSHRIEVDTMDVRRQKLNELSEEDGIIYLMDEVLRPVFVIQKSWITAPDTLVLKYEDILGNEFNFSKNLIEYCEIEIEDQRLESIIKENNFEAVAGRKRGEENTSAHLRKGVVGDWQNHFTEKVKTEFKKRYGRLLIDTGYEKDLNW
ncbi:MAG: sulfotransferase domain-containing protein [Anaerolineales bacterium]|nr:sulfotransferase domain-containing protein [Anaerolineales bacterium]